MKAVNKERMLAEFKEVVAVPSHTLQERPVFELLRVKLEALGFIVEEDDAGEKLGGNCGNLWAFLPGNKAGATSVLFSAHMDGVEPCGGTTVVQKDGYLYSEVKMIRSIRNQHGIPTEAVNDHVEQYPVETQFHVQCIACKHLEQLVGVIGESLSDQVGAGDALFLG